jgi:hypothetical protein
MSRVCTVNLQRIFASIIAVLRYLSPSRSQATLADTKITILIKVRLTVQSVQPAY